jgi:queuosine precursor transporter
LSDAATTPAKSGRATTRQPAEAVPGHYYPYVMAAFVAVLLVSNTVANKLVPVGPFVWSAAIVIFPVSYILGDVITEVYGYARARRIFWVGTAANVFLALVYTLADSLPSLDPQYGGAFHVVLGPAPRVVVASLVGLWCGQFANAWVMSRMKVLTRGRALWARCVASTFVGEGVDTAVFATLLFAGVVPWFVIPTIIWSAALFKTVYEAAVTPLTYLVVNRLKRAEGWESLDESISYTPFSLGEAGNVWRRVGRPGAA